MYHSFYLLFLKYLLEAESNKTFKISSSTPQRMLQFYCHLLISVIHCSLFKTDTIQYYCNNSFCIMHTAQCQRLLATKYFISYDPVPRSILPYLSHYQHKKNRKQFNNNYNLFNFLLFGIINIITSY